VKKPDIVPREEVVSILRAAAPRALHVAAIAGELGVARTRRTALSDLLDDLVLQGRADALPGSRYRISEKGRSSGSAKGEFRSNPRGFGFVVRDDGKPDVFIDVQGVGGALHLDTVEIEVHDSPKGPAGQVVRVAARGLSRVPGLLRVQHAGAWLEPDDARVRGPIDVERTGLSPAQDGKAVVVELTKYPERPGEAPAGKVLVVLGEPGDPRVELEKILLREAIETDFPVEVVAEATEVARPPRAEDLAGREDLRKVPFLTIDPKDARDHDDAIAIEEHPDGALVRVAIADVSHYVRAGGHIDANAKGRGTSIYLPARVIPMLPLALSADICSLVAGEDRLALVVEAVLDEAGTVLDRRFLEAVVRPAASLHYEGVARCLGLSKIATEQRETAPHHAQLQQLHAVTRVLRARRVERGSIDFDLPEPKVELDPETGAVRGITRRAQDPGVKIAYSMVEEMMLLANELVAQELGARGLETIYRVHGEPDDEKFEAFCTLARAFGLPLAPTDRSSPKKVAAFLRKLRGKPMEKPLQSLLLRTMQQARYEVENIGHFGLASAEYLHFTSPIRRYPDLAVHRTLRAALRDGGGGRGRPRPRPARGARPEPKGALVEEAALSSRRERRAMEVEREVVDLYRALCMQDHLGEEHEVTVTGIAPHGIYCELDDPYCEGLLLYEGLSDDRYEPDEAHMKAVGERTGHTIALGERLRVIVADVSLVRRTTYLRPATERARAESTPLVPDDRRRRERRRAADQKKKQRHGGGKPGRRR